MSMVFDQYAPKFPPWNEPAKPYVPYVEPKPEIDWTEFFKTHQVDELKKLIKEFKEAVEHAKKLDILMKQPDCEDPEKAKLLKRVAELEAQIKKLKPKKKK